MVVEMSAADPHSWRVELSVANKESWLMKIKALLTSEEYIDFVAANYVLPVDPVLLAAARKKIMKARAIIIMRLSSQEHGTIVETTTEAKDLWQGVLVWTAQLNKAEVQAVVQAFQGLKMQKDEGMHAYITRATNLRGKLKPHQHFVVTERDAADYRRPDRSHLYL
jgi:hypothetical protein